MTGLENIKYDELCRLCATRTTMVLAIHLFENEGSIRQISKKIDTCLHLKVHESDELPKMICENCLYKLELVYDFRERCIHTEKILKELYKQFVSRSLNHDNELSNCPSISNVESNVDLIVQHSHLQNYHDLDNVTDINLTPVEDCNTLSNEHQMMLAQQSIDVTSHTLESIDVHNGHSMSGPDHSSHSIHLQESTFMNSSDALNTEDCRIGNLNFIADDGQSLNEQLKLQLNTHDENTLQTSLVTKKTNSNENMDLQEKYNLVNPKYDDTELSTQLRLVKENSYYSRKKNGSYDLENFKLEETNSSQMEDQTNTQTNSNESLFSLGENIENKSWYYCDICGLSSDKLSEFDAHYENHFFKCEICLEMFTNIDILNSHRKSHGICEDNTETVDTALKQEMAPVASWTTDSEESLPNSNTNVPEPDESQHANESNEKKKKISSPKVCSECGKTYKTNYKLIEHMRKHTGEKPYQCKSCEKAFRSKIGLAQHEAKHTGKYDLSCPTCGKGFQCKSYLMVHQKVHSSDRPYPCERCGQNFKTKQSLLDHTNRHLGVKPHMCDICGRCFITKGLCKAHQKTHTGLDNRKYPCKICNKMFVSKSYLQTHLRIHTGEKPFICEVCGKGFLTRVDLKIHSTMHTGEKSYTCEICGKAFARRDALRCHRRSHTGERPYSCDLCGQTFTQFTPMAIHKRLHTGERPYACETCGKTFVSRSTMMSHAKKHVH